MKMTLCEFELLNDEEKAFVAMQGDFLDVRIEGQYKVALYSHPGFYTEVFYDGLSNAVVRCRGFTSSRELAAYIRLS